MKSDEQPPNWLGPIFGIMGLVVVVVTGFFTIAATSQKNTAEASPPETSPAASQWNEWKNNTLGIKVISDPETGCEYIAAYNLSIVPRYDRNHEQICR